MDSHSDADLKEMFSQFLEKYTTDIRRIADTYPEEMALVIDYSDIELFCLELADFIIKCPYKAFPIAREVITETIPPDRDVSFGIRVKNLPGDLKIDIRNLRSAQLGNFIAVEGLVRKATEVRPRIVVAKYECLRCGQLIEQGQHGLSLVEPLECYKEQAGCGRTAATVKFSINHNESEWVDAQKIEIQEFPEGLQGGAAPQRLTAFADEDLAGIVFPGDRITLLGTLHSVQKNHGKSQSTIFDIFLEVNYIEIAEQEFEEIVITEEEEIKILEESRNPDIYSNITSSIAPSIYGFNIEKEALALQLFGGIQKNLEDGTRIRGDIHILLIGDPGTGKSQILRYMSELTPRGIYTSGKSTTNAGLTASAVRDEFGEGRWTLEAGALVLADRGMALVDELDKMDKKDRGGLHEAMEQQQVSVAKAGITATLQSRCSMLAAANPKYGRFDDHSYTFEQINLPITLLSRFDIVFCVTDKPDPDRDEAISNHIMKVHVGGEHAETRRAGKTPMSVGWGKDIIDGSRPYFDKKLLRKYIAYAKKNIIPIMTPEAWEVLKRYYLELRNLSGGEGDSMAITARQLEGAIRLTEASARVRLSAVATASDAERAVKIIDYYLRKTAGTDGRYDIDIITSGISEDLRNKIRIIKDLLKDLGSDRAKISQHDVIALAEDREIKPSETKTIIKRLLEEDGFIFLAGKSKKSFRLT